MAYKPKEFCRRGHSKADAYQFPSGRKCRTCAKAADAARPARHRTPQMRERGRLHSARWREENREKYLDGARRKLQERGQLLASLKDRPCADCGQRYPYYVMDFDHRPGAGKVKPLSQMRTYALDRLMAEVAKCDVVCSNCHRERTHRRITTIA